MTASARHDEMTRVALERCAEALRLRQQGLKLREIGEHFRVSVSRASQLVARGEREAGLKIPGSKWAIAAAKAQAKREAWEAGEPARRAARERQERLAEARDEAKRAAELAKITEAHANQVQWRQFLEQRENWRRNDHGSMHAWLDRQHEARGNGNGITYRGLPGRLQPEWSVAAIPPRTGCALFLSHSILNHHNEEAVQ